MRLILILLLFSLPTFAQERLGFTLSGGVSLGSYEAGVFYQLIQKERLKLQKDTKVVFGASAGSINGLFGIMDICGHHERPLEETLLWKMWIPNGIKELEPRDKKEQSLLSRKTIYPLLNEVRKLWNEGLSESCDIVFGAAVTRKSPLVTEHQPGLEIIRQPEFFTVRIKGRGKGKAPLVENYQINNEDQYRTSLPVGESPAQDVQILLDLIQASSAFPGAFTPYPINFCFFKPRQKAEACTSKSAKPEFFIDGGIYHNGPVGYAYDVLDRMSPDNKFQVYFLNASAPVITEAKAKEEVRKEEGVVQDFYHLLIDFTVQARMFELTKSLESKPGLAKHIRTNPKTYPLVSEPLFAFLGFVEKDFRISDFYLGMNDADKMHPEKSNSEDPKFICFKKYLKDKSKCELDHNLKILADMAKFRRNYNAGDRSQFDVVFDYLEDHNFEFKDLGLKNDQSNYGRVYLKERLYVMLNRLVKNQPEKRHEKLQYFIRPSLNFIHYTPPKAYWSALYGTSPEIGYSRIIPTNSFARSSYRMTYNLMLNGFSSFFSRAQDIWAFTPLLGVEYEPVSLNSPVLQWHGGARLGYILAPRDNFGRQACDAELSDESSAACSGATLHLTAAATLFELLRLQLVVVPLVVDQLAWNKTPEFIFQIGFQIEGSMFH